MNGDIEQARLEIDTKEACNSRNRYIETFAPGVWQSAKAGEMKISNKAFEVDKRYYFRVRVSYTSPEGTANTSWSPVISAVYKGEGSGVEIIASGASVVNEAFYNLQGVRIDSPAADGTVYIRVATLSDGTVKASKVVVK